MADILIHRCTVRVVRRDGWSWGPDPRQLVDRILRDIPALLERALAEYATEECDYDISAPLKIQIPIRWDDLHSQTVSSRSDRSQANSAFSREIAAQMEQVIRETVSIENARRDVALVIDREDLPAESAGMEVSKKEDLWPGSLENILLRWHYQELLHFHLSDATTEELEAWHELLRNQGSSPATSSAIPSSIAADLSLFVSAQLKSDRPATRGPLLAQRIDLSIRAAKRFQISPQDPILWQVLDELLPLNDLRTLPHFESLENVITLDAFERTPVSIPLSAPVAVAKAMSSWDVHVPCALPFLLLGPLSSFHFLEAMQGALEAAKISHKRHLIAASLAYKVLDPPDRGWLRSAESLTSAAAFAGQRAGIDESELTELARQLAPYTKIVDRVNADVLLAGHTTGQPFVISRADTPYSSGYLLFEAQGSFPVQWANEPSSLVATLSRAALPIVLVTENASDPKLLDHLNRCRIAFIVATNPVREELWNRVPISRSAHLWTNHAEPESLQVLQSAGQLDQATNEAAKFWEQVGASRISAIRATPRDLDRSLTLAAGTALGTIAWKLWSERGRTTPQLALERYRDLEAHVNFSEDLVRVRLPLGRRHRELFDHGLLAPIEDALWFGNRRLEFAGG